MVSFVQQKSTEHLLCQALNEVFYESNEKKKKERECFLGSVVYLSLLIKINMIVKIQLCNYLILRTFKNHHFSERIHSLFIFFLLLEKDSDSNNKNKIWKEGKLS